MRTRARVCVCDECVEKGRGRFVSGCETSEITSYGASTLQRMSSNAEKERSREIKREEQERSRDNLSKR